jgi:hypothetical protein
VPADAGFFLFLVRGSSAWLCGTMG